MKSASYWKTHYIVETDADEIERNVRLSIFASGARSFELLYFERGKKAPNILISPGSAGHSYVFAELGYQMYLGGYNVFIMPKHGGHTIGELVQRHSDALEHLSSNFSDRIGVFGEGLGGFVVFYLALAHGPMKSAVYQNAPGLLTEKKFQETLMRGRGAAQRRKLILPPAKLLFKIAPWVRIPISLYLDFEELVDTKEENREVETRLVKEGYLRDPDFDRWYPLAAVLSLVLTPPPNPISELKTPTMFLVPVRGWTDPSYVRELYHRLPSIRKSLVEVDGSVFWMCSHPKAAAKVICEWFDETV
jgi:pimeloyl-ACP methyl ester carboxylesterase